MGWGGRKIERDNPASLYLSQFTISEAIFNFIPSQIFYASMLELRDICFTIEKDGNEISLLDKISLKVPSGHFMAVVGPSGCGKTTLMKIISGLLLETEGEVWWRGSDLSEDGEMLPNELGYVPQFSIAYDHLTVEECVEHAIRLRVGSVSGSALEELADNVIQQVGMETMREKRVKVLSGGQKRRLGLGLELVTNPKLLLCDEVTSGLDPQSEREIVNLMHQLSMKQGRMVMNITHSLANLELYDSVLVLHEGRMVFHGPPDALSHYFSVQHVEDVYLTLKKRPADAWQGSWAKYRNEYDALIQKRQAKRRESEPAVDATAADAKAKSDEDTDLPPESPDHGDDLPGFFRQFWVLLSRRWLLFFRDRTQVLLQLALMLIFPLLVVIFAPGGIEAFPDQAPDPSLDFLEQARATAEVVTKQTKIGALVSGLMMFQVVLLALMGSNNAAREIAGERLIYEKERLGGVRPFSYLLSKVFFLGALILAQSLWMGIFVQMFCNLPGDIVARFQLLIMINAAMTFVCLGISAAMRSADQASLLSIYLVGFQLPLSGAVLRMPSWLEPVTQPLIAAYWSWSGQLQALSGEKVALGIKSASPTYPFPTVETATVILGFHVIIGLIVAYGFCKRRLWD